MAITLEAGMDRRRVTAKIEKARVQPRQACRPTAMLTVADKSKHHIVSVRGMKVTESDQTPPHGQRGVLEAHARISPRENGRLHGSHTMQEVPSLWNDTVSEITPQFFLTFVAQ